MISIIHFPHSSQSHLLNNLMELRQLFQSLIPTADTFPPEKSCNEDPNYYSTELSSSSNADIISRIVLILLIGTLSIWANHEASKGFVITIINDAGDSPAGKRFTLFYQSNDKAARIVLSTSKFVENILYSQSASAHEIRHKKINHVKLCFGRRNLTEVEFTSKRDEFILHLSHSILTEPRRRNHDYDHAVYSAVQRGMARIWLWNNRDGDGKAPAVVVDAMVESISSLAGYGGEHIKELSSATDCFRSTAALGRFMSLCELQKPGFLGRLNENIKKYWDDGMVEGMPAQSLCPMYNSVDSQ